MLAISINGRALDLPRQEINTTWAHPRFADALQDQFTTDIEIPLTQKNRELLGDYGILDGNYPFSKRIQVSISLFATTTDGYMHVTKVTHEKATATVFFNGAPYEILERKIREIRRDVPSQTIFPFDNNGRILYWAKLSAPTKPYAYYNCVSEEEVSGVGPICHPSWRLNDMFQWFQGITGVSINFPNIGGKTYRILCNDAKVCPENNHQTIASMSKFDSQQSQYEHFLRCGQHVCNDGEWNNESLKKITFNRACLVELRLMWNINFYAHNWKVMKNGSMIMSSGTTIITSTSYHTSAITLTMAAGDTLEITKIHPYNSDADLWEPNCVLDITYLYHPIYETDYGNSLEFDADRFSKMYQTPYILDYFGISDTYIDGTAGTPICSWRWFGMVCNLPDYTVRELLNGLIWITGGLLNVNNNNISFETSERTEIVNEGYIEEVETSSDLFGRLSKIEWSESNTPWQPNNVVHSFWNVSNEFIEGEVVVHKSIFKYVDEWDPVYASTAAFVCQYYGKTKGAALEFNDVGAVLLTEDFETTTTNRWMFLRPPKGLESFLVDKVKSIAIVTLSTLTQLSGIDSFYYKGRKYIIIDTDTDTDTGECTCRAFLI